LRFADDDEFEEFENDEVDGEFTPLTNHSDEALARRRKNGGTVEILGKVDPNFDRRLVPAGYFPQWPSFYPQVSLHIHLSAFKPEIYLSG
jgi:hypothetical protein